MSDKTKNRILSLVVGAVLASIAILFQDKYPDHPKEVQVGLWSFAVFGIIVIGNRTHYREKWFWQGLLVAGLLHIGALYSFEPSLPFSSLGVAILLSIAEAILLQGVFRRLSIRGRG